MWGQVAQVLNASWNKRIIPTRVGTSEGREPKPSSKEDHPHACGDKSIDTPATFVVRGSSPRVWGQDCVGCAAVDKHIIIPTRVGTRHYPANLSKTAGDHPHACGDKSSLSFLAKEEQGSSPRVWGQALATSSSSYGRGIIPTRVGTSTHLRAKSLSAQDHPHACGDKQLATCFTTLTLGSSPRVWGQVRCAAAILRVERIIPTRVGTSL